MMQDYYSQFEVGKTTIVRLIPAGDQSLCIVQKTSETYGSYIRYGYGTVPVYAIKSSGWTVNKFTVTRTYVDIPAVNIPAGEQVITPTSLVYHDGDKPIAYATGGHGVHMDIRLTVVAGVWNVTRRNTYSVGLDSTGVRIYLLN